MKQEKITTSKGEFLVVDGEFDILMPKYGQSATLNLCDKSIQVFNPIRLSEITELEASEIVDKSIHTNLYGHYVENIELNTYCYKTAIESLHSLLKSKGIHLYENPYTDSTDLNSSFFSMQEDFNKQKEAEQKTFYNPYIFKL